MHIRLATLRQANRLPRKGNKTGGRKPGLPLLPSLLGFDPNRTDPIFLALLLWIFRARFLRELFRFEWLRQERDLAIDVLEQEPLHNGFGHLEFIA
jgi:hypothetical protein